MISSVIIFTIFIVVGFLTIPKITIQRLGKVGMIVLPIALLGIASIAVYGFNFIQIQLEPKYHGESSSFTNSWRTQDSLGEILPSGFQIETVMPGKEFSSPTSITLGDNGEVYLATAKGIFLLDQDLKRFTIFDSYEHQEYILGMAFNQGSLYVAQEGSIIRLQDTDGDNRKDISEEIVSGLPHQEYSNHSNNGITFGPDGLLYLTVGSTSDHGPEESPIAGSVMTVNPDGTDLTVYANGFRNPFDLAFCSDGTLFATDNGPDQPRDTLLYRPPDELNLIQKGKNYGYPDYFGYPAPWSDTESPIAIFPMSATATGIACYEGEMFPEEYKGNLFVTQWGSMVIPEQTGHKLVRIELQRNGDYTTGIVHDFANFWRPLDVIVYTDGSLLVLDFDSEELYRIKYKVR